ncbi:hypothetical protein LEN26_000530 [Aphanomyces euteiches]|nr:hypothetical protein LEN26_000530 [Aphanomyces euteiches]
MAGVNRILARLIENVALEGRSGISVYELFERYSGTPDSFLREACWTALVKASATADEIPALHFSIPSRACDVDEIAKLTLKDASHRQVYVVACQALRYRALHLTNHITIAEDSTSFLILETVGKSRAKGLSTMDINTQIRENIPRNADHKKFDAELRTLHHYMDRLISQKLLVKKMLQITENFKCKRFNMVLLPRFDSEFDHEKSVPGSIFEEDSSWKYRAVDHLLSYLSQQENRQCTFNDGMRGICAEKKKLEALKNHIICESKKAGSTFPIEIFTAQRSDARQKFWCLRLRDIEENSGDAEEKEPTALVHEMGLLEQIFNMIVAAGDTGVTSPDLKNSLGLHGKTAYRIFNIITTEYPVRMEKTVIGRNSVYRLFSMISNRSMVPQASNPSKGSHKYTLRKSLVDTVSKSTEASPTDTTAIRRQHILDRLRAEKVVSLYSLRSSIIELENYAHDGQRCHFNSGHRVDVRSIIRIVELHPEMKLQYCEMPLKSSLLASSTKTSRLILHVSATQDDLKTYLNQYSRDSRLQALNSKAFVNPNVMIHPNLEPSTTSIAYKFKNTLTVKSLYERDRERQSHLLGKCHGFLYRCRLFHIHLFEYLQTATVTKLLSDAAESLAPDRLFTLDPVFRSMPVVLYVRILGIGQLLLPDEVTHVQNAIKNKTLLADLPKEMQKKITHRQNRRLTRLLRTLIDLRVIRPYRLSHDELMTLLEFTDDAGDLDVPRLVQYTLYDRLVGGFFVWHHAQRLHFEDPEWNTWNSVHVNTTRCVYSFGHEVPLAHTFSSREAVELFWEAMECCAVEQLAYSPAPGQVVKVPPLDVAEHITMSTAKNWTPNTHGVRFNRRDKKTHEPRIPGTNKIIMRKRMKPKPCRPLRSKKYLFVPRGVRVDAPFTPEEDHAILQVYFDQLQSIWKVPVPVEMQLPDEPVAIRNADVFRTHVSMVSITRAATSHRSVNRVRRRIEELLGMAPLKLQHHELKKTFFGSTRFTEEDEVASNPRLSALVTRVFMILFTSDGAYNQMAAEHLVGAWSRQEITLVWRYFWLKGWIVAPKPYHIRGFVLTRRFQEIFKGSSTVSYPLAMFIEAAEQASFLESRDVDDDEDDNTIRCCSAIEHAALVLGQGSYEVQHTPLPEKPKSKPQSMKRRRDHRHATSGVGLLNHLDQSELDQWQAVFHLTTQETRATECAFSHQMFPEPPLKRTKTTKLIPFAHIEQVLLAAEERGLSIPELVNALNGRRAIVEESIETYQEEGKILQVDGWTCCRYVLPQFGHIWTVYPYATTSNGSIELDTTMGTTPHPWLKLTTQPNGPWLVRFQRKLVALLITYPGCGEDAAYTAFEGVLPLQQLRILLSDLVQEEVIYARIVERQPASFHLFGNNESVPRIYVPGDTSLLQIDRSRYVVHYFPTPDCIVKYGFMVKDINRL